MDNTFDPPLSRFRGGRRTQKPRRRDEAFAMLLDFARAHKGNSPTMRGWWMIFKRIHPMSWTRFRVLIEELKDEGKIDLIDGEIVILAAQWESGGE
ncbi:MAG: hypothetical protein ABI947_20665 [Chloroflexota bacterium]